MSLLASVNAFLKDTEAILGSECVTWRGQEFLCSPTQLTNTTEPGMGGYDIDKTLSLVVRAEVFTELDDLTADDITETVDTTQQTASENQINYPEPGDLVTYKSAAYRIETVTWAAEGSYLRLDLTPTNA